MLLYALIAIFGFQIFTIGEVVGQRSKKPVVEIIRENGYPLEEHVDIQTADGYLLQMQRIPYGRKNDTKTGRPPVLLMHGISGSAENWVATGPGKGLAFILADLGYDVWLGNARGTTHSRKHVRMNPDIDSNYWLFSWHEIGVYDLPAKIDHILNKTGQEQIFYIGHSQGTTCFFVLAATRPQYNKRIRLMTALGPVVYMTHMKNPFLRALAGAENQLGFIANTIGLNEFFPHNDLYNMVSEAFCNQQAISQDFCTSGMFLIGGFDSTQINRTALPALLSGSPAGFSTNQLSHYAQGINSGRFSYFDYGPFMNLGKYNSMYPPRYRLERVTAPVALYYGKNDLLIAPEDVHKLEKELPNVVQSYLIPYKYFNHFDFLWANDVVEMLYNRVISVMSEY